MSARASRIERVGEQECPRRAEGGGHLWPLPDYWETGTWARNKEEADAEVAEFMAGMPASGIGNVLWLYPGNQPRTCSFCGGGHPDDLTDLIRAGWEIGPTDKGYKHYLEPPGFMEYLREAWSVVVGQASPKLQYPLPVPPVKLYVQHFSPEQIAAFNAAVKAGV